MVQRLIKITMITVLLVFPTAMSMSQNHQNIQDMENNKLETATFGAGCFWCVEAVFQQLKGVEQVTSGYSGGHVKNPAYKEVTRGNTGHAEAIQIQYDPQKIQYEQLLEVFWKTHDPTTLNRQGADIGPQYRSVIFFHNQEQKAIAEKSKQKMDDSGYFDDPIVTAIEPYKNFYVAEDYHQDFYKNNPNQPYCRFNIDPKMEKLQENFGRYLK
jgi:peptide-methionine (S)-S-oxide reductase